VVGADNVLPFEPTMGAEDFSYFLQAKPGCYFTIGNGDGSHREGGPRPGALHAAQPQLRLQRRADPAGRHRLGAPGRAWLATRAEGGSMSDAFFAQSYAEARGKFLAAAEAAGLDVHATATRCWAATARNWRWTWRAAAPADAPALLIVSSGCHGVEGFCGSGVQGALLADAAFPRAAQAAGVAVLYVHALNPWGFSWWRRTRTRTSTSTATSRLQPAAAGNAGYDEIAHLLLPATGRPRRERSRAGRATPSTWPMRACRPP
jgi:hypothetical protein